MTKALQAVAGAVWFLAAAVFPVFWDSRYPTAAWLSIGILGLVIAFWYTSLSRQSGSTFALPKIILPLALLTGLQAVHAWRDPLVLAEMRWILLGLIGVIIILAAAGAAQSYKKVQYWEIALIAAGLFVSLFDLVYLIRWHTEWWRIAGAFWSPAPVVLRIPGLLSGHPNLLAGFLNLSIPLVLARILLPGRPLARLAWSLIMGYLLVMIYQTASRTGLLGVAAGISITVLLWKGPAWWGALRSRSRSPGLSRNWWRLAGGWRLVAGLLLLLAVMAAGLWLFQQANRAAHGTAQGRLSIWQFALEQIVAKPAIGHGMGTVPFLYTQRADEIGGDEVHHAHNLWLQILAGCGLLGLALVVWAIILTWQAGWSGWRAADAGSPQRLSLAAYGGVAAALAVESMLDFYLSQSLLVVGVFIVTGLVFALAGVGQFFQIPKRWAAVGMLGLFLAVFGGSILLNRGQESFLAGVSAGQDGNWQASSAEICQAADQNPFSTYYPFQCTLAATRWSRETSDRSVLESAVHMQRRALERDPYWYLHWANLAADEWQLGEYSLARQHMRKAVAMAPKRYYLWLNLGWMAEQAGDEAEARQNYHTAYCLNPWLAGNTFFERTPLRQAVVQEVCPKSPFADGSSGSLTWSANQAYLQGDFETAQELLLQAVAVDPGAAGAYLLLARVHQKNGQLELARKEIDTAALIWPPGMGSWLASAEQAKLEGEPEKSWEFLARAFQAAQEHNDSSRLYSQVYDMQSLPSDLSPFLVQAGLALETEGIFEQLAAHYQAMDDPQQAETIRRWLAHLNSW